MQYLLYTLSVTVIHLTSCVGFLIQFYTNFKHIRTIVSDGRWISLTTIFFVLASVGTSYILSKSRSINKLKSVVWMKKKGGSAKIMGDVDAHE